MRKRLLIALVAVVLVLLGVAAAVLVVTMRKPPAGKLDTALTGVSVATRTVPPPTSGPGPEGKHVDQRCWLDVRRRPAAEQRAARTSTSAFRCGGRSGCAG